MQRIRMILFGVLLVASASTGAATKANCCYPGSKIYYDETGAQVGYQMIGCGDDALYGEATSNFKWVPGCIA